MVPQDATGDPLDAIRPDTKAPLGSVDKALRLLELLGSERLLTVSRAADELGVARSTAHRLLASLQVHGFAVQDPATRAYAAGTSLLRVGLAAVESIELRAIARPEIERLSLQVRETVHLITLEGARTFVLDSVESPEAVRVSARLGRSAPANVTAAGKLLLSELDPIQAELLLGPEPLPGPTPNTLTTHAELARALATIRDRGYATNDAENEPNLFAVSVRIPPARGIRPAALSVAAPALRVNRTRIRELVAAARDSAARIGELAGAEGPRRPQ